VSTSADETATGLEGAGRADEDWQDQALGVLHEGDRHEFGFGSDYYGIWDKRAKGAPPIERYPATDEGRAAGWDRYVKLEPEAAGTKPGPDLPHWIANPPQKSRRGRWVLLGIGIVVIGGVVALLVTKSGGDGGEGAGSGTVGAGSTAHIEVTTPSALSADLPGKTFEPIGFDTLGPRVTAVWENANARLTIRLENPKVGETTTRENPATSIGIQTVGQPEFVSKKGECSVTFTQVDAENLAGSFDCTGIPSDGSSETMDASGTFQATSG
jgi:hypothetical protein